MFIAHYLICTTYDSYLNKYISVVCDVYVFLQWLEDGFLKYLQDWEDCVHSREGFSKAEMQKMQLSRETIEGLRITGEFTLITMPPVASLRTAHNHGFGL